MVGVVRESYPKWPKHSGYEFEKKLPFQNPSLVGLRMGIDADPRAEPELDCKEDDLLKFSGTLVINHP